MNTETFLHFFFNNNAVLINVLVVVILLSSAFLTYRSFKASKDEELGLGPSGDFASMEEMLKKILEKANGLPTPGALAQSVAAAGTAAEAKVAGVEATTLLQQITSLKKEIETKQSEIETIKKTAPAGAAAAPGGISAEEKIKLENQVKELQRKLEEFDIISADIADLSFYKEENLRLQKELGNLKGSGAAAPSPAAAPAKLAVVPDPEPEPTPSASSAPPEVNFIPAEIPEAREINPVIGLQDVKPSAPAGAVQEVVDEDLIKEYAAMVDAQRSGSKAKAPAAAPVVSTPPKAAERPKAVDPISGKDTSIATVPGMPEIDIPALGENKAAASTEADVDLGTLDLDKMAAEALDLKEPAAAPAAEELLNQSIDADKLANEASKMTGDPDSEEVMGQFEQFSKKEK